MIPELNHVPSMVDKCLCPDDLELPHEYMWGTNRSINDHCSEESFKIHDNEDPSTQKICLNCVHVFDTYLNQQWKDSQVMLKCVEAWKSRSSITIEEATHALTILGLRSMEQTLHVRQGILQTMTNSPTTSSPHPKSSQSFSMSNKSMDGGRSLLRNSDDLTLEAGFIASEEDNNDHDTQDSMFLPHPFGYENDHDGEEFPTTQTTSTHHSSPLPSHRMYAEPKSTLDIEDTLPVISSRTTYRNKSDTSDETAYGDDRWTSWFDDEYGPPIVMKTSTSERRSPKNNQSSISTFRPISKNLAPRCIPSPHVAEQQDAFCPSFNQDTLFPGKKIVKSRSFTHKNKPKEAMTPTRTPTPKVNQMMRSIVSKKRSLTKIFSRQK